MAQRTSSAYPHYEIWYVEKFPLAHFDLSYCQQANWIKRNEASLALLEEDIRRQGLVNPLICRYNSKYGDSQPLVLVGGARLPTIVKLGYTECRMVVCGDGGKKYDGAIKYRWEDPELHALFKDGYLGLNTTGLCMARCSNRSKGEMPGPDSKLSYKEAISDVLYAERPNVPDHTKWK